MRRFPLPAQRRALGEFLRTRRASLTPDLLGLPAGARRRTPGLRREEVALVGGISATWYSWIEQGRDVSVSPEALSRLAQALRLSPAERAYLFELAAKQDPVSARAERDSDDVPAVLVQCVRSIRSPAYLLDRLWRARAWNQSAVRLFVGWLDRPGDRSLLHFIFLEPSARRLISDWEERARRVVAEFRADHSRSLDDPSLRSMVEALARLSPFFARAWAEHSVLAREGGERRFNHPKEGPLRYQQTTFVPANRPDFKLVMLAKST